MITHRRIRWIVLAAVAAGPVAALALVLGPAAGAREPVITAAVALSFALGWTLLAVGSAVWTDQPQRWAAVPAALFAALGALCLVPHPGAAPWVVKLLLPAGAAVLAVWVGRQVRRSLRSRTRWVLYAVAGTMASGSVAAVVESAQEQLDRTRFPMHGQLLDVGGYRMNLSCSGTGAPTVVLMAGAGETSAVWAWIAPAVSRESRVCVFDRAGRGRSDAGPGEQDGVALAADLHTALHRAGVTGPVVLVGHSFGGLYARVYAARYPAEVGGMVLLDATHPEMFTRIATYPTFYQAYRRISALFPTLARLGVGRMAYRSSFDHLPATVRGEQLALWSTPAQARSQRDEWAQAPALMKEAGALTSIGDRPLVVVTAMREAQPGWLPLQQEMLALSTRSAQRIAPTATHMALVDTEAGAAISIAAIREVVGVARATHPAGR